MWWDDYLVIFPVLFDILCCISLLVVAPPGLTLDSISKSSNHWLGVFLSSNVIWLSRICFLLLLARLFPPRHIYRRITLALVVVFLSIYITMIVWNVPPCDMVHSVPPPSSLGKKNCKMPAKISARIIFGLTADLLSDLILVGWPLVMLYKVKLSRPKDRPLVMISLGCSIFTFLLVLVIVIFACGPFAQDRSYFIVIRMLVQMAAAVSLITCNMPIVACAAYRAFQKAREVPLGTVVAMPDASHFPTAEGRPGTKLSTSSFVSNGPTAEETRLTYDDLTRISMSFEMYEVQSSQIATNQNQSANQPGVTIFE
ncbi:hypothetical protein D9619_002140 [Psilocybe cf. subviscida]|uniref:Rhodopsin domain-containing protein n=1 Tax=Psilocybe cf. subviscida TaxID=2480587 RepID=A0A8H5F4D5_9AGAR|nr:hypothetical protein D9619_002140 [Psilocybe cf. subviscida]